MCPYDIIIFLNVFADWVDLELPKNIFKRPEVSRMQFPDELKRSSGVLSKTSVISQPRTRWLVRKHVFPRERENNELLQALLKMQHCEEA